MKYKQNNRSFIITELVLGVLLLIILGWIVYSKNNVHTNKIAVIVPGIDESQWSAFKYGLNIAAQEYGVDVVTISKENMESAQADIDTIYNEIDKGADAVIVMPITEKNSKSMYNDINNRVPVVFVGDSYDDTISKAVEPDSYAMGADLAQKLLENNSGDLSGKKIGIYSQNSYSQSILKRKQAIYDTIKNKGGTIIWDVAKYESDYENELTGLRQADIVLAMDDESLVEAGQAASENSLGGAVVYGFGSSTEAVYYLDTGWVECLAVPDGFEQGYRSVMELVKKLNHPLYRIDSQQIKYKILTRDTLFSEENKNLLFTISQ